MVIDARDRAGLRESPFAVLGFVREHSDGVTCRKVLASSIPVGAAILYTEEWGGITPYVGTRSVEEKLKLEHGSVKHGEKGWARDDDGDGKRDSTL